MRSSSRIALVAAAALVAATAGISVLKAQQPPAVKRNIILKQDMAVAGREAVMAHVELPPGSTEGRHTHPAEVYAFVEEGTITVAIDGQPTKTLKAGEVFTVPPGVVHEGSNKGDTTVKLSVVFVAEKGKPLTTKAE